MDKITRTFDANLDKRLNISLLNRMVDKQDVFSDDISIKKIETLLRDVKYIENMQDYRAVSKAYHKNFKALIKHIKTEYDMTPKGNIFYEYSGLGLIIGSGLGVTAGSLQPAFYSIGIGLGLIFGVSFGRRREKEAADAGKLY